tara:strand:- start:143 stop:1072 length:930 start_codon:yes stop_codon:yes gene_type:complete
MIKKKLRFLYFILSILTSFSSFASYENSIVLKVDDQIITSYEIKNKILSSLILSGKEFNQTNIDALKKQSLDSLIQLKIKSIELSKYDLEISDKQINQYLNSISSNNIQNLKNKFIEKKVDFKIFYENIETEMKWQKFIYELYSDKISVNENQIKNELDNSIKENKDFKEYNLSEVEIFINENDKMDQKIDNIINQFKSNGFEKTAQIYSISSSSSNKGSIGWVSSKSLSKDIHNILKKMTKGEISKPIKRQNSVLFLKINDTRIDKLDKKSIANLEKKIINQKKNELFNLYSISHLSKLKNNSLIEYK